MPLARSELLRLFVFALAVRWAYDLAIYFWMGPAGLMGNDSQGYLVNGQELAAAITGGDPGWNWLGTSTSIMPLFSWLVAINVICAGAHAQISYVLMQGLMDAGCCVLIYLMARTIEPRWALAAGIAAAINPLQIILAGYLYTDTPFLLCVALFLLASLSWLQEPDWRWAAAIGIGLGAASMIRVLVVPWSAVLLGFLVAASILRHGLKTLHLRQLATAAVIFLVIVAPLVARNVLRYDAWALTSQSGAHYSLWVAPLVSETNDGAAWAEAARRNYEEIERRFGLASDNPFEESRRHMVVGREMLMRAGFVAAAKAWTYGAVVNFAAPALTLSPPMMRLPRTSFYDVTGQSAGEKIFNFLASAAGSAYLWVVLLGVSGLITMRALQLAGLWAMLRQKRYWPPLMILLLWIGFILMVNGPVVSPKYRLPIEPALAVFTAAGYCLIRDLRRREPSQTPAS
jgi:hypothetical protein